MKKNLIAFLPAALGLLVLAGCSAPPTLDFSVNNPIPSIGDTVTATIWFKPNASWLSGDTSGTVTLTSSRPGLNHVIDFTGEDTQTYSFVVPGSWGGYSVGITALAEATGGGGTKSLITYLLVSGSADGNDSTGTATPVTSGYTNSGYITYNGDLDYYTVTVSAGQTINLMLDVPTLKDFDLVLMNSGSTVVDSSASGTGTTEIINYTSTSGGTYYIKVYGYAGAFDPSNTYILGVLIN